MKLKKGIIKKFGLLHYPDGKKISPRLPEAYQMGTTNQNCANCVYLSNTKCNLWKGNVRDEYWCKSWKRNIIVNNKNYKYDGLKETIMASVRRRIRPDSINKNRLIKNNRTERVRNKLIKNNLSKLKSTGNLDNMDVPKLNRETKRRINSIGSLKRSRKRK